MVRGEWSRSVPLYLGSLRDGRPYIVTLESDREIEQWADTSGYKLVGKPWRRIAFVSFSQRLGWIEGTVVNLTMRLTVDTFERLGHVAEWRPLSGIAMQIYGQLGLDCHAVGGFGIFRYYSDEAVSEWKLICGASRHQGDIDDWF